MYACVVCYCGCCTQDSGASGASVPAVAEEYQDLFCKNIHCLRVVGSSPIASEYAINKYLQDTAAAAEDECYSALATEYVNVTQDPFPDAEQVAVVIGYIVLLLTSV